MPDLADPARPAAAAFYQSLVDNSCDLILTLDAQGRPTFASAAAHRVLGADPGELLEADWQDRYHRQDGPGLAAAVNHAVSTPGYSGPVRARRRAADGTWRHLEVFFHNLLADPAVAAVVCSVRDISERVQAQAELAESEARFRDMFASAPAGILLADDAGVILDVNQALADMVGQRVEQLRGRRSQDLIHPEDLARLRDLPELDEPGRVSRMEVRYAHPQGWRWALESSRKHHPDGDRHGVWVTHLLDVHAAKAAEGELRRAASTDPLTGLLNRSGLDRRLPELLAGPDPVTVWFADLVGFQRVNDAIGHAGGDALLVELAARIRRVSPDGSAIARVGGDEFLVAAPGADPEALAEDLQRALSAPAAVADRNVSVTVLAGVALAEPGQDPAAALAAADAALFEARHRPGGGWVRAEARTVRAAARRAGAETDLRRAVERGELVLAYQPVFAAADGRVCGAEALLRWDHPEHGLLLPAAFLDVAASAGLLEDLTAVALEQACAQAAAWQRLGPLTVSVNVSARQLGRLSEQVAAALAHTGAPAHALVLEVGQAAVLAERPEAGPDLARLAGTGVTLAMAGAGTREAPLASLADLPQARLVKVDRRLVSASTRDLVAAAVVAAVVQVARAAGCAVVGEGVESRQQLEHLLKLGCAQVQGLALAAPGPAAAVEALVVAGARLPGYPQD